MKNYQVCIDYKNSPSFQITIKAEREQCAEIAAKFFAKRSGFIGTVKKINIREQA